MWEILVNGVDQSARILRKTIRITKDGAVEDMNLNVLDWDLTAGAFRLVRGDRIRASYDGDLEFGGQVDQVIDERLDGNDGGGTVTKAKVRGWAYQARQTTVTLRFPDTPLFELAYGIFLTYLQPKGWTWVSPTTGGPLVKGRSYEKKSLEYVFNDWQKDTGYPWRVNGDQEMGFIEPGTLTTPTPLTVSNDTILLGLSWQGDISRRINFAYLQTGTPKTGAGPVQHHETHPANGVRTVFPVNVESGTKTGAVDVTGGAGVGATSMPLDGLYPNADVLAGDTFTIEGHASTYTLTAPATSDGNGRYASVAFTPGLDAAIDDNTAVTFASKTYVRATIDGVDTPLYGGVWDWDDAQQALVTSGAAPTVAAVYRSPIRFPAWVRSWTPAAVLASGAFDYGVIADDVVAGDTQTDLVKAKEFLDAEIDRRDESRVVQLRTFERGFYPWQKGPVYHPDRLLTGDWFVTSVTTRDMGRKDELPHRDISFVEVLSRARFYYDYFRERGSSASGGVGSGSGGGSGYTGGGSPVAAPFIGYGIALGGSNIQTLALTTSWQDVGEANPLPHPADAGGTWTLRVYAYQLAAGTMEVRLVVGGVPVTLVSTTTVGSSVDVSFYGPALTNTYTGPASVGQCLLQARVTSGARVGVVGLSHTVKTA